MGVRIACTLDRETDDAVVYAIAIEDPSPRRASVTVGRTSGAVEIGPWTPDEPEAETVRLVRAFLRGAWSATRKAAPEPWPRKIVRWRP